MRKEKADNTSIASASQMPVQISEAGQSMRRGLWKTWWENLLLYCFTGVYVELCLHLCVFRSLDRYAGYLVLFGLLGGALVMTIRKYGIYLDGVPFAILLANLVAPLLDSIRPKPFGVR